MTRRKDRSRLTLWTLVHLGHEMDEIAAKIRCLATLLNHGHIDDKLVTSALHQVKRCGRRLETTLNKSAQPNNN